VLLGTAGLTCALALASHALRKNATAGARFTAHAETVAPSSSNASPEPRVPEPSVPVSANVERGVGSRKLASAEAPSTPLSEDECKALAANGKNERAVECYRVLGRDSGIGADVALYQAARLELEKLGNARRALGLIAEHRRRFPTSSLGTELEWLHVRSLQQAGRFDDALRASEALLATPGGALLSADLHALRASIEGTRGDCADAVSELLSLASEPGARGDDAEFSRAGCLEKLGRSSDARAAYVHYLERSDARHAIEARARVVALGP
jgi:hypothetical protein